MFSSAGLMGTRARIVSRRMTCAPSCPFTPGKRRSSPCSSAWTPRPKAWWKDAASAGFYESPNGKKYARVQLLTIADLLEGKARAEHPDYEPDLNFKKAKQEAEGEQKILL